MTDESSQSDIWAGRIAAGDPSGLAAAFGHFRGRLRNMVQFRLDPRLAARVDPSDVLQEAFVDATQQVQAYVRKPRVAMYVWLRGVAAQRLAKVHRRHLGTQARAAGRELSLPVESSVQLAGQILASGPTPSQMLEKEELRNRVQRAVDDLDPIDREVILMRDFEDMTNTEVAQALELKPAGAAMRYGRAMFRLKELLLAQLSSEETKQ